MNKFLCVILTLGLLFTLAACGDITIHVDFGKSTGNPTQTTAPTEQPLTQGTPATEAPTGETPPEITPTAETPTENQQVYGNGDP